MDAHSQSLETLQDIRRLMQRSSRFLSLSGLSGIAAGVWGLVGAWLAHNWIAAYRSAGDDDAGLQQLVVKLVALGLVVLVLALISASYFTWRKASKNNMPVWDRSSRKLIWHLALPLLAGGLFILAMLQFGEWRFVAPASLIFYGLALVNGSKFTLNEVQYLGVCEVVTGLISTQFPAQGLYFWAFGFGILHIVYGLFMWWKYDRQPVEA